MLIAGVVIITDQQHTMQALEQIQQIENVSTYGIHKDFHIIAVFEGETPKALENLSDDIMKNIDGVLGVYPTYINYEQEPELPVS